MKEIKLTNGEIIKMREPKVKDIRAVKHIKDEEDKEYALISNLTGISEDKINELSFKDFKILDESLQNFL